MATITAGMVGELRAKTDAPMMECKKALTEAEGDMARAEEILRVKLGNKAGKAASRITAEGVVAIANNGGPGAMPPAIRSACRFTACNIMTSLLPGFPALTTRDDRFVTIWRQGLHQCRGGSQWP